MRFFILALCINLILLALPLNIQKDIKATTNQTKITIALQENNIGLSKELAKTKEYIKEEPIKEIEKENVKEELVKKEPIKKEVKKVKKLKKQQSIAKQNKVKDSYQQDKVAKHIQDNNGSLNVYKDNHQTYEIFSINDDFCRQNVVFDDIDNSYPKKAKMLKKFGAFDVVVRFGVNDKSIKIIDIKGDKLFVEHTKKLFKNLNYKIKDKRAYECIFIKTIRFELNK